MINSTTRIKLELLCKGVRISDHLLRLFPGYLHKRASLSEGMCFDLFPKGLDHPVKINLPVREKFVKESPFSFDDQRMMILKDDKPLISASPIEQPSWYKQKLDSGTFFQEIFQLHYKSILATSLTNFCDFKTIGKGCKFCAMGYESQKRRIKSAQEITAVLKELIGMGLHFTEVNLNSGTLIGNEKNINLYLDIVKAIRELTDWPIYAQLCPPADLHEIDRLVNAGITSLSFNMEIYDKKLRKKIMPAKGRIPIEHYLKAMSHASKILGRGQISSWLIAGLEPQDSTIEAIKRIAEIGVIPFVTVFRPLTGSEFENQTPPDPASIEHVFDILSSTLSEMNLRPCETKCGCVKCNCCSALSEVLV